MKQIGLKIIIILLITSCSNYNEYKKLILGYESLDFETLKGLEIRNRGTDNDGNIILLIFENNSFTYDATILIDYKTKNIISVETIKGNQKKLNNLNKIVNDFFRVNVKYLKVDSEHNIYINPNSFEHYNLVKVQDSKIFFNGKNRNNFKEIINDWYLID